MEYKAIIFDLFGTLVKNYPVVLNDKNLKQIAVKLEAPPDDFLNLWNNAFSARMKGIFNSYQECIGDICRRLEVNAPEDQIESASRTRFATTKLEVTTPREGAVEVLSYLKARGYKTGLLSNCSMETTVIWNETVIAPLIDVTVFSCLEGTMKPDPRIYRTAIERLGVKPEECLYIADGMSGELTAANKLGMGASMIRVPDENDYDCFREEWHGITITSLKEIPDLIENGTKN